MRRSWLGVLAAFVALGALELPTDANADGQRRIVRAPYTVVGYRVAVPYTTVRYAAWCGAPEGGFGFSVASNRALISSGPVAVPTPADDTSWPDSVKSSE